MGYNSLTNHELLMSLYYDVETGFMSEAKLLQQAKAERSTITREEVHDFIKRQPSKQKAGYKTFNSFIADYPKHEYQIDIAEMGFLNGSKNYALVCIDVFSRYGNVEPLSTKSSEEIANALDKIIQHMGTPQIIYSDDGFQSSLFQKLMDKYKIHYIATKTHAAFAERFIRTLKKMLSDRVEFNNSDWVGMLSKVLKQYNNEEHRITKFKPVDAFKDKNVQDVKLNLLIQAKHARRYPDIAVGDKVKIYKKVDKYGKSKEWVSRWSNDSYTVNEINNDRIVGNYTYKLDGIAKPLLRHELLLV